MTVTARPLTQHFGVELTGLDLANSLSASEFAFIRQNLAESGVVLIRGQAQMSPADQVSFSKAFGPLEKHVLAQFLHPAHDEIFVVSNIVEGGQHIGAHGGSKEYHSDLAYMAEPSLGSVFHCIECPKTGGETAFVSMAAAYDALPEGLRQRLNGLDAIYDYAWSYDQRHLALRGPLSPAQRAKTPEVIHPAVRAHPETGRPALFLSDIWIKQFVGVDEEESQAMLQEAVGIATRPEAEYRHAWAPGDVVVWDNRSTMHRACPFDDATERRLMHRTTITGDQPIRKLDAK